MRTVSPRQIDRGNSLAPNLGATKIDFPTVLLSGPNGEWGQQNIVPIVAGVAVRNNADFDPNCRMLDIGQRHQTQTSIPATVASS